MGSIVFCRVVLHPSFTSRVDMVLFSFPSKFVVIAIPGHQTTETLKGQTDPFSLISSDKKMFHSKYKTRQHLITYNNPTKHDAK